MEKPDVYGEISTGTSIISIVYNGGVLIGADTRTTSGSYVSDRAADKLEYIHDRVYCLCSGSAADTRTLCKYVNISNYSLELGKLPQVKTVGRLFSQMMYQYKDSLSASIIVCGWDSINGPQIFCLPPGGSIIETKYSIGGSGSGFIYGYCDINYKDNMSLDEAKAFITKSLALAMNRDCSSGGFIRIVNITKDNVTREVVQFENVPYQM